ncbi:hypothetical protein Nepgr_028956 [Nepenthes gracilis]|uniref:Uncharacterized protein n=1 Tax=Nepenthes gracilis TaxID=150966 RepID=A0AAD3TD96_NEPGR|nr:hypothetical protein Nepgr_028956 [Nepenthes gracilis]
MDVLLPGADQALLPCVTTLWMLMVAGLLILWSDSGVGRWEWLVLILMLWIGVVDAVLLWIGVDTCGYELDASDGELVVLMYGLLADFGCCS